MHFGHGPTIWPRVVDSWENPKLTLFGKFIEKVALPNSITLNTMIWKTHQIQTQANTIKILVHNTRVTLSQTMLKQHGKSMPNLTQNRRKTVRKRVRTSFSSEAG